MELMEWIEKHGLGGSRNPDGRHPAARRHPFAARRRRDMEPLPATEWSDLHDKMLALARKKKAEPDTLARNISELAGHMGLGRH